MPPFPDGMQVVQVSPPDGTIVEQRTPPFPNGMQLLKVGPDGDCEEGLRGAGAGAFEYVGSVGSALWHMAGGGGPLPAR
jgi:hypothetical protein